MVGPDSLATTVAPPRTPSSLCHDMKNSRRLRKVSSLSTRLSMTPWRRTVLLLHVHGRWQ